MKKVAIVQSNYIPWKGYFDLMGQADEMIFYDDAQYTKRDWRNRNRIKTPEGLRWLTIPVETKGRFHQRIKDVKISDRNWGREHWKAIVASYSKAPYFKTYQEAFEPLYLDCRDVYLSRVNRGFLEAICRLLGIAGKLSWSMDYMDAQPSFESLDATAKLAFLCRAAGATHYLSGPRAKDYLNEELFEEHGIGLSYMDYAGYLPYRQLHGPFVHEVSIIDLIFNEGPAAKKYMKSFSLAAA